MAYPFCLQLVMVDLSNELVLMLMLHWNCIEAVVGVSILLRAMCLMVLGRIEGRGSTG